MSELGEFFNKSRTMLSAERGERRVETAAGQLEMTGTGQVGPGRHTALSRSLPLSLHTIRNDNNCFSSYTALCSNKEGFQNYHEILAGWNHVNPVNIILCHLIYFCVE